MGESGHGYIIEAGPI